MSNEVEIFERTAKSGDRLVFVKTKTGYGVRMYKSYSHTPYMTYNSSCFDSLIDIVLEKTND